MLKDAKHTNEKISEIIEKLEDLVLSKNTTYGDSLQNPVRVFSKSSSVESICGRIDDKLSRIQAVGVNDETIDTIFDLMGYYIHLLIAYEREN
jgi:predicted AAA+ superfamily ATPase